MPIKLDDPGEAVLSFLQERHLATLTTLRADGSPHVVAIGFGYDPDEQIVRVITFDGCQKVANVRHGGRAAVSQVDGGRWLTLEGVARLVTDRAGISKALDAYAKRYRPPADRPDRVAIEIAVDKIIGRA